jgi:pyruvate-formate lyase-activating enzyme
MGKKLKYYRGEIQYEERLPLPKNMLVEVTNACNLACEFCAHSKMRKKIGFMDMNIYKSLAEQAFAGGVRDIGFYLTGEPLVNNRLSEYVYYAKQLGFTYIYITSNGVLAELERMKEIVYAGLDSFKFSINAGTRETYMKIHGRDEFDNVISNLKDLSGWIRSNGLNVGLFATCVVCDDNKEEVELLKSIIGDYVDDIDIANATTQGGNMSELNETSDNAVTSMSKIPCNIIFDRLNITWDGKLTACCVDFDDNLVVADLKNTSLIEAWNSDKMVRLRRLQINNEIPQDILCYNCLNNTDYPIKPL